MDNDKLIRGFYWSNKAWYAEANGYKNGLVNFGMYSKADGGTTGEMTMEWVALQDKLVPQLSVFDDAWKVLAEFKDVFDELAKVNNHNITDRQFVEILKKRGFKDLTDYTYEDYEKTRARERREK